MAGSERSGPLAASADPLRRPALGGDAPRRLEPGRDRGRRGAGPPGRRERRTPEPGGARRRRRAHLPPAPPAVRAGGGPAGRRPRRPPRPQRAGGARRDPGRRGRPGAVAADRHRQRGRGGGAAHPGARPARRPDRRRRHRRPRAAGRDPRARRRRHPARSRASTAVRRGRRRRCSSRCPTIPASWRGCSPTPARATSTSRTCASTTTPRARRVWSSSLVDETRADHLHASLASAGWETHR